ncbi:hypothetical protein HG535_0E05290 [Zygotorulaspora mrakii]|uniref:Zinc/iron permease n=1 Tax=Zygotorulaspora mrakii TaxID=42260 RepID=A0A7H9B452_ZYGMR|nr:uncharacterized protein HG535_0E05290 [Zygotorulaspora mrakii]QLG73445.1 hypothetical protein HG535_0E05290 [Zygotorulaspora mrakii]
MLSFEWEMPKWLEYSLISSLLCVLGGLCVPLISYCFRTKKDLNTKLVNYGLSLSAGSMLTTALYRMLPSDYSKHSNPVGIFLGLGFGMALSLVLNYVVHACASESLMHCAHDSDFLPDTSADYSDTYQGSNTHSHSPLHLHSHSHGQTGGTGNPHSAQSHGHHHESGDIVAESTPFSRTDSSLRRQTVRRKSSLIDMLSSVKSKKLGDCKGLASCPPMTDPESFRCIPIGINKAREGRSSISSDDSVVEASNLDENGEPLGVACLENEIGYDLENLALYRKNFHDNRKRAHSNSHSHGTMSIRSSSTHNDYGSAFHDLELREEIPRHHQHHHHLETPFSKLLSIGLQTCVVISLHKFPEGFIIYYTNQSSNTSKDLGFSIFLSLTIHNFVEGFSMTLPFYAALENKVVAILITTLLGGCTQPLGAMIGYLIFKDKDTGNNNTKPHMDTYLSITAGFLLVIGLQMFQTAVGFSQSHHHHQGEGEDELKENHSSGSTCLKWCCVGVLLIVSTGILR